MQEICDILHCISQLFGFGVVRIKLGRTLGSHFVKRHCLLGIVIEQIDMNGKQPIEDGIDVVAVDSLAFQRYCELASLISKPLTVVTDNDGNAEAVRKRYEKYTGLVTLCVESDNTLNTLEPSVLAANLDTFESFKSIIYLGKDIESRDPDSIKSFMIGNKTDWSMRVFTSEKKISLFQHISLVSLTQIFD